MTWQIGHCLVCSKIAKPVCSVMIFRSLQRDLYQCQSCGTCFYPRPDWLERAYSKAISDLDTGIVERANDVANVMTPIIFSLRSRTRAFLDFGGGLGLFSRVMRDRGWRFQSVDPLATSVFSIPDFDTRVVDIVTMIEVLEHLTDPLETICEILQFTDNIFISTHLIPASGIKSDWWYLLTDTGQHIFFPSVKGMEIIAQKLQMHLVTNGVNLHLLMKKRPSWITKFLIKHQRFAWLIGYLSIPLRRSKSLSATDGAEISKQIYKSN